MNNEINNLVADLTDLWLKPLRFANSQTFERLEIFKPLKWEKNNLTDLSLFQESISTKVDKVILFKTANSDYSIKAELISEMSSLIQAGLYIDIPKTSQINSNERFKQILDYLHSTLGEHRILNNGYTDMYCFDRETFDVYLSLNLNQNVDIIIVKFGDRKYFPKHLKTKTSSLIALINKWLSNIYWNRVISRQMRELNNR